MSIESTRDAMMKYFNSDHTDLSMMADDVVFTMMATGQETRGREAIREMLHFFYHVAFDATATTSNTMFADQQALVEGEIIGKHIGEFAGVPATGRNIRVPICVVYDLESDRIKRARIYFEIPVLMQQLGAARAA